jgi:hypothetical protein
MLSVKEFDDRQKIENSKNIAIDFDGVIHKCSKGYHDGTVYDDPIEGSLESLKKIKAMGYNIIIFSCKSRSDRPFVNGKSGTEMIWDWLKKYDVNHLVSDIVSEKPRAAIFIDDKGYRFENWTDTIKFMENFK